VEKAKAPVVTEAAHGLAHRPLVGGGKRVDVRKRGEKALEYRYHRLDDRLLEHDLADPNDIGVAGRGEALAPG
jgi:hypothetical protein